MVGSRCYEGGDSPCWKKAKEMDILGPWEQYDGPRGDVILMNVELKDGTPYRCDNHFYEHDTPR